MSRIFNFVLKIGGKLLTPQKPFVFSGPGSIHHLVDLIAASGHRKPLLMADGFLIEKGMLDEVLKQVSDYGIEMEIYDGVLPNPTLNEVREALKISLDNQCDSVLAIGGGSVIDVAKVVAAASTDGRDPAKLAGVLKIKTPPLPFYVVPTTSGTGSETTSAAIISDPDTHKKMFFVDPKYVPAAASLDANILKTLPANMTAAVGMDALTHAIEAYTSVNASPDTDRDAATAVKLIVTYLPICFEQGDNLKARGMLAHAAFLAGYAFAKASLGYVHAISHQISAHYNTPHGLANAVILPRVLRFNREVSAKRFAELEMMLNGEHEEADFSVLADRFIERVDVLSDRVQIPVSLTELEAKDYGDITKAALSEARWGYPVPKAMRKEDVLKVLDSASGGNRNVLFS